MIGERVYTEDNRHRYGTVEEYSLCGFNHWIVKWDGDDARERVYGSDLRSLDPDSDPTKIKDLTRWHLENCLIEMDKMREKIMGGGWKWNTDAAYILARNYLNGLD